MKKNNKGFFLAETIIVVALVTTVMAFVYPNVTKLYDNYKNRSLYYDQTEDLYNLKAIYEKNSTNIDGKCDELLQDEKEKGVGSTEKRQLDNQTPQLITNDLGFSELYISTYMASPSDDDNYNFNKYLKRLKKVNYDDKSCRLIGVKEEDGKTRYASIKLEKESIARSRYKVPDLKVNYYVELIGVKECTSTPSNAVDIVSPTATNNNCKITGKIANNNVTIKVITINDVEVISNIKVGG